jgi:hypothetical protein
MRARRWISIFALFGVLLHAGAIVRHNAAMTGAALQYQALVTGLAELCHGSGTAGAAPVSDLPYIPRPSDAQNGCPICSGLSPLVALAAPAPASIFVPQAAGVAFVHHSHCAPVRGHAVCPPARGPPAVA